ncbi:MAG TPA: NUMOD4 motif-containing HNH endonuclease [Chitinophagales bacterium]|nr:NUMOD4 motif-containing HNH endonuclease [Chitinophagales bacterium]
MCEEIWKPILGYEKYYLVSSMGVVVSLIFNSKLTGEITRKTPLVLKGNINSDGYRSYCLKGKNYRANRLVAIAFIPNPDNKPEVNHKNGVKLDNSVDNLEWATRSENELHAYKVLNIKAACGEQKKMSYLKNKDALFISQSTLSISELNKMYPKVGRKAIFNIKSGISWKHVTGLSKIKLPKNSEGTKNPSCILNENSVREIFYSPEKTSKLSITYNISVSTIKAIKSGRLWKHLNLHK